MGSGDTNCTPLSQKRQFVNLAAMTMAPPSIQGSRNSDVSGNSGFTHDSSNSLRKTRPENRIMRYFYAFFGSPQTSRVMCASDKEIANYIKEFRSEDKFHRTNAISALVKIGPHAVPALIAALRSKDKNIRTSAASALITIGPPTIPQLIESLADENDHVRHYSAAILGKMGRPAIPALKSAICDRNMIRSSSGSIALSKMGVAAIPTLMETLHDNNPHVRIFAASALGRIGPSAKDAINELNKASKDPDESVSEAAAHAIAAISR